MKLPIQDRRALIQKHNREQEEISKEMDASMRDSSSTTYEGESLNTFAKMEQSNQKRG
jgi:hypothetical protein